MHRSRNWPEAANGFIILLFLSISICVFRSGIYDLPRMDHLFFMKEQDFAKSDWEYFWRMISYNRSAYIAQGDYFLYRPGFFGYLALVVIFFREHLLISGIFSLALHAICTFVCYRILKKVAGNMWAMLLALTFCIQYSGMEMLIWRHISPYMIGMILFFSGIFLISKEGSSSEVPSRGMAFSGFLLFLSTLFHESFPFTLFVLGIFSFVLKRTSYFRVFFLPALLWLLLNIADYAYYHPESILGTDKTSPFLTLQNSAFNVIFLSGLFLCVFLCPFLIRIEYENFFTERGAWDPTSWPTLLIFVVGVVFLVFFSLWMIWKIRNVSKQSHPILDLRFMMGIYFIVLVLGFGVGRLTVRTTEYLRISTYYYYISNFCFIFFLAVALQYVKDRIKITPAISILMIAGLAGYAGANYGRIQQVLSERVVSDRQAARVVSALDQSLSKSDTYCYGGALGNSFVSVYSREIILKQSCLRKRGKPVYLIPPENSYQLVLAQMIKPHLKPVPVSFNSDAMEPDVELVRVIDSDYKLSGFETGLLSLSSYEPVEIAVDIKRLSEGGIVFAYQNERNLVALHGYRGQLLIFMNRWGVAWSRWYRNVLVGNEEFIRLSVRKTGSGLIAFFCNDKLIEVFPQGDALQGRIGLYSNEKLPVQDLFRNLTMIPKAPDPKDQFEFWPILEIPLT